MKTLSRYFPGSKEAGESTGDAAAFLPPALIIPSSAAAEDVAAAADVFPEVEVEGAVGAVEGREGVVRRCGTDCGGGDSIAF